MPGGHTKFSGSWLSYHDSNGQKLSEWCKKGKDDYNGYCCLCKVDIKCDNAGKAQLLQHAKRKKHTEVIKHMQSVKQSKLLFSHSQASSSSQGGPSSSQGGPSSSQGGPSSSQGGPSSCQSEHGEATQEQSLSTSKSSSVATLSGFVYYDDALLKAEIYWLAKVACSNYSLCSCDHVGDMFRAMFPDSKIAAHFSLSRTSSSYIISEGLSSYFTKVIIDDLQRSKLPFSIHFDETSTSQVKKQMDLTLRYWSPTHEKVWTVFYTSLFFGHATADIVSENMYHKMCKDGIPVDRICTLVRDGPNVNKAIFRKMNELILQDFPDYPGLVDIGSCSIHVIHNAFGKGLEHYGKDVDQLCLDLYSLFKYSAARREDFKEVQVEMELDTNNFLQHTEVRWLSIGPSIKRILEQWDAITHFVAELAKDSEKVPKSINFKRIYTMLGTKEKQTTRVTLEFLSNVIPVFEKFLLLFQKSSPVVHFLYDEMCEIILKLLRRFIRPQALANKYGSDLASIECQNVKIQLSEPEIVIGEMTRNAMAKLTSDQQKQALLGMRSFFKVTSSQLQVKLPLDNLLLRQLGCLNPLKREKKSTVTSIQSIAMKLQPKVDPSEVTDEWKLFQVDNELPAYDPRERIEVYWNKVSKLQAADGELRYKTLPTVIKSGLVLAQTNAESERSLSVNARIVTKDRALLGEKTIVGLHVIKDAVRFYDPELSRPQMIPVTEELKRSVRQAHSAYRDHLEKEKEEKERKREEARKKKESSERAQREKQKLVQQKETLAKSEEELNEEEVKIRADVEAADELLKEATAKLNSALETKPLNKQSVTVAQMMLETATTKRENAMKQIRYGISRSLLIRQHTNFWMKLYTEKENQIREGKQQQNKDVRRKSKSEK